MDIRWSAAWLAAALVAAAPARAQDPAAKIIECMRANIPPTVRIQTVEITAVDRAGGERSLRGKLYGTRENDRVRVMVRVEMPKDLAGASYLVREGEKSDEMYIYLPAVKKVRRITGASVDGQLWGTDLSYNDVKQVQNAFSGAGVKLEGSENVDGRGMQVLSFTPRKLDGSRYSAIRAHVDQQTCVALKVEFLEGANVRKIIESKPSDLKQAGKYWYVADAVVKDLKDQTQTRLRVLGVTSADHLSASIFNPGTFYLGG
ncbi:MAG TPA: outer membrane lipoprotein-sorting protein [Candidatus Binatia bacterium]|nr:outer membrane lipoprotein-sorting protein [Candidatus Binatia bacterium]